MIWRGAMVMLLLGACGGTREKPCPECPCPQVGQGASLEGTHSESARPQGAASPRGGGEGSPGPRGEASSRPMSQALASRLVALSLDCARREYPNKPSDVQSSDADLLPPRKLHPAFFGCFDWHSAVHGHWTMVRILKRFPGIPEAGRIRAALGRSFTKERIKAEVAYFKGEHRRLFERPYGWAWLLRLAAELRTFEDPAAKAWARVIAPLEKALVELVTDYLPRLSLPVRAGTHNSTAFALAHIRDYALVAGDQTLVKAVDGAARRFYLGDRGCPTDYEPSGEDFLSPCLAEADLMRRALTTADFRRWLGGFLPPLDSARFRSLAAPPRVLDPSDAKIGHLIGLMFHRAWTMRGISQALEPGDPRRSVLARLSARHEEEGLRLISVSGYGGSHWLASFAVFTLTDANL